MIYFYSGTPGSGKSLHMAREIFFNLRVKKRPIIANFPIDYDHVTKNGRKKAAKFTYAPNHQLSPQYFYDYARKNHVLGKEGQTVVCIDECQVLFNPREFSRGDRLPWIMFFTQHRKLGYHFILVSQFDRLVDRQIRCLFEYDIKHRKLNNFGPFVFLPVATFVAITYWYGVNEKCDRKFFTHKRKHSKLYDSFMLFDGAIKGVETETDTTPDEEGETVEETTPTQRRGAGGPRRVWAWLTQPLKLLMDKLRIEKPPQKSEEEKFETNI